MVLHAKSSLFRFCGGYFDSLGAELWLVGKLTSNFSVYRSKIRRCRAPIALRKVSAIIGQAKHVTGDIRSSNGKSQFTHPTQTNQTLSDMPV